MPHERMCEASQRRHPLASFVLLGLLLLAPPAAAQSGSSAPAAASQPVKVADLIGVPIVDQSGLTLGHVRTVVGQTDGKIQLIMPMGGLFGFGERLVPIPIESVVMAGTKITVVDLPPDRFQKSPTWYGSNSTELAAADTIRIGVANR